MKRMLLFSTLVFARHLFAGDGAVSLSPAVIILRGETGQSTTQTLLLRNGTSRALSFEVSAEDVVVRDGKRAFVPASSIAASVAATAVFSEKRVTVAPGEAAPVTITVTIPPNAATRAVVARFRGLDVIRNGAVGATASLGALLTFALSDDVAMTPRPLVVQPQTATSSLTVAQTCTNSGREPLVAKGIVAVIGDDGRLAGKASLAPHRLLPGEEAQFNTEYSAELAPGRYRVLVTYDYEGRALTQSAEVEVR